MKYQNNLRDLNTAKVKMSEAERFLTRAYKELYKGFSEEQVNVFLTLMNQTHQSFCTIVKMLEEISNK